MASTPGIDPRFFRDLEHWSAIVGKHVPRYLFRALKRGLYQEGNEFKKRFREGLNSRFKIKKSKVGNLFKVYTAGDRIGNLTLGIFTIWEAAPVYEDGGTIAARSGGWLMVALDKAAYTAGGRVKRSWRDPRTGKFARDKVQDLVSVPIRGGQAYLLFRASRQVTSAGEAGRSDVGHYRAWSRVPVFMLIRDTRRQPALRFFSEFAATVGVRGERLGRAVDRALEQAAAS